MKYHELTGYWSALHKNCTPPPITRGCLEDTKFKHRTRPSNRISSFIEILLGSGHIQFPYSYDIQFCTVSKQLQINVNHHLRASIFMVISCILDIYVYFLNQIRFIYTKMDVPEIPAISLSYMFILVWK